MTRRVVRRRRGRATRLAQKSHPKFWPSDFELLPPVWCIFCPVRPSGSYVPCDDLQELCVSHIGSFCVPWHCSLISQSSRNTFRMVGGHRCLSRGGIGGPRLVMASLFVSSFCVHVISCYRCGCVFRFVRRARAPTNTSCTICVSARTNRAICSSQRLHGEIDNHVLIQAKQVCFSEKSYFTMTFFGSVPHKMLRYRLTW